MIYSGQNPVDRRAFLRKSLRVRILMTPPDCLSQTSGRTQDISPFGLKVKPEITPSPFQKGDEITFIAIEDFLLLQGRGRIHWTSTVGDTVGVEFTQLTEGTKRSLDEFSRFPEPITNGNN